MKNKVKILVLLLLTCLGSVLAAGYPDDITGHSEEVKIKQLIDRKITSVDSETNKWFPNNLVIKADIYKAINELIGQTFEEDISKYKDINSSYWYYEDAKKAEKGRYSLPKSSKILGANSNVEMQELFVMISIALDLPYVNNADEVLATYEDSNLIRKEYRQHIANYLTAFPFKKTNINANDKYELTPNKKVTKAELFYVIYEVTPIENVHIFSDNKIIAKNEKVRFGVEYKQNVIGNPPEFKVGFGEDTLSDTKFIKRENNVYIYEATFTTKKEGTLKYKINGGNLKTIHSVKPKYITENKSLDVNFGTKVGTTILRYVDENYKDIVEPVINNNQPLFENVTFSPRAFLGYIQVDNKDKTIKLVESSNTAEVIFKLQKEIETGTISVKYVDDLGNEIATSTLLLSVVVGKEEQVTAKNIDGYSLTTDYLKRVTISRKNENINITYVYEKDNSSNIYLIDLAKYNISKDNTNATATTNGINLALKEAYEAGYKKVKLPPGNYAIDGEVLNKVPITDSEGKSWTHSKRGITIPYSDMEFDIRGCTLTQVQAEIAHSAIITISSVNNVNIVGGTLIGDRKIHYYGTRVNEDGNSLESGNIDSVTGQLIEDETKVRTKEYIDVFVNKDGTTKPLPKIFFIMPYEKTTMNSVDGGARYIYCYDVNNNYLGMTTGGNSFIDKATLLEGTAKIKVSLRGEKRLDAKFYLTEEKTYPSFEFGACLTLGNTKNVEVIGTTMKDATGDCIFTIGMPLKVTVDDFNVIDCDLSGSRRQGISYVSTGERNLVKNTKIYDINGIDPQCGIDFEHYDYCKNTIIDNCEFYNNKKWDIINYNGTEIEVKNSTFKGAIADTFGHDMDVHDNYFEYDDTQEKVHKFSGVNLGTKNNRVYNNKFVNSKITLNGEGSLFHNNVIEGGQAFITKPGTNSYKNVDSIFIKANQSNNTWYGSKFENSNLTVEANATADKKIYLKEVTLIDTPLLATSELNIENAYVEGNTRPYTNSKWSSGSINLKNSTINSPNIGFLGNGSNLDRTFNNCNITSKRENGIFYNNLSFADSTLKYITGDSNITKVIPLFSNGYGKPGLNIKNTVIEGENVVNEGSDNGNYTNVIVGEVIKTNLTNTLAEIKLYPINSKFYTINSVTTFNTEKVSANTTINDINAKEVDVTNKLDDLLNAFDGIKLRRDILDLTNKIIEAKKYIEEEALYTKASIDKLKASITKAETILSNSDATQAQVDAEYVNLESAISKLELVTAAKQELLNKINEIEAMDLTIYTDITVSNLNNKLRDAKTLYNATNSTKLEIVNMVSELNIAVSKLEIKLGDKVELEKRIREIETMGLLEIDYTQETYKALQDKIKIGKEIILNPSATQAEANTALTELNVAYSKLLLVVANKTELQNKIKEIEELKLQQIDYTEDTFKKLQNNIETAKIILADQSVKQSQVNSTLGELNTAFEKLITKPGDKKLLQAKVDEIKGLDIKAENYTEATYNNLKAKLQEAENIILEKDVVQSKINSTLKALTDAYSNLEKVVVTKTDLKNKVEEIKKLNLQAKDYTEVTYNALQTKLQEAEEMLLKENAMQAEINSMLSDLNKALENLQKVAVDKTLLKAKVEEIKKLNLQAKDYTEVTYNALQTKLQEAEKMLSKENATQDEINSMLSDLNKALENLQKVSVDKTLLKAKIEEIKKLNLQAKDYTEATYNALQAKLQEAEKILAKENATQIEIDNHLVDLTNVYNKLQKKSIKPNDNSGNNNNNSNNNNNNNSNNNSNNNNNNSNTSVEIATPRDELGMLIKCMETMDLSKYTEESINNLKSALESSKKIYKNIFSSNKTINNSIALLKESKENLKIREADIIKLADKIKEAEGIEFSKYTEVTAELLKEAISKAKIMLEKKDNTYQSVDAMIKELENKINLLEAIKMDKDTLRREIEKAQNNKILNYTKESIDNLEDKLDIARKIYEKENPRETEIKQAIDGIKKAVSELEELKMVSTKTNSNHIIIYVLLGASLLFIVAVIILAKKKNK